jgi:hypothetical protein
MQAKIWFIGKACHLVSSCPLDRAQTHAVLTTYDEYRKEDVREIEEELRREQAREVIRHRYDEKIVQDRDEDEEIYDQHQHPRREDVAIPVLYDGSSRGFAGISYLPLRTALCLLGARLTRKA